MRYLYWILLTLRLLHVPAFAQSDPHTLLYDAMVLENRGSFEAAAKAAKAAIESRLLSRDELGRGYIILAVACQGAAELANAQAAFEQALLVLEHDQEHPEDYASALENYAGFYSELGQLDVAAPMWRKALELRQRVGDHAGSALSLIRLAELALARNRVRPAEQYLQKASEEAKAGPDFLDEDQALFLETQGWLAIVQHHALDAVTAYQQALDLLERSRGQQRWLTGWEYMLLGKAYAESRDFKDALANMQTGLRILDRALGQKNAKYFAAKLAYSVVLDQFGAHAEAAQMRAAAKRSMGDYYSSQCAGCTINKAAFR